MMRRFGEPVVSGQKYRQRTGAYAVLARGRTVLVTLQSAPSREYQLPGGGLECGESMLCALRREVLEETGWTIAAPKRLGAFRRFVFMPEYGLWAEKICHIYQARPVRRLGPPKEVGHSAIWMDADAALHLVGNEGDRHFLGKVFGTL